MYYTLYLFLRASPRLQVTCRLFYAASGPARYCLSRTHRLTRHKIGDGESAEVTLFSQLPNIIRWVGQTTSQQWHLSPAPLTWLLFHTVFAVIPTNLTEFDLRRRRKKMIAPSNYRFIAIRHLLTFTGVMSKRQPQGKDKSKGR